MRMIPLIIDTDVALGVHHEGRPRDIDDGFAIVEAINSDVIELLAVTTVFGNGPLREVDRVAREIIQMKGVDVPVYSGAAAAIDISAADMESGAADMESGAAATAPNAAVAAMAEILAMRRSHIAAIGPLTNIGLLIEHFPQVLDNIESIIIVAGRSRENRFYLGDKGPVRDFNFENDVAATRLLLDAGLPLVLAGFELTSQVAITEQDLETIAKSSSPTARYFYDNSLAWCRHWTKTFPSDVGFHPWDSAAISWLKHPDYFASESRGWRIRHSPEDKVDWLETDPDFSGSRVTFCTGFATDGARRFVEDVVTSVY
jgi:inosine-uridine nucleoside N-ribohydrolase